jgi:RNA polymerase sigma-70 factor (ECF subfamily)
MAGMIRTVSATTASLSSPQMVSEAVDRDQRLAALVTEHYASVWRVLRRTGLSAADAEDATQRVFVVFAKRFDDVRHGCERAFLFRTALHVGAKHYRAQRRRPETTEADCDQHLVPAPSMEDLLDQQRARALLDRILSDLPADLRAVLVLFEIEGLTKTEVADALGIPPGTVASRLRRARELVLVHVTQYTQRPTGGLEILPLKGAQP